MLTRKFRFYIKLTNSFLCVVPMLFLGKEPTPDVDLVHETQSIAFEVREGNQSSIFIMEPDGENQEQLTDGHGNDMQPHWSPDGQYILFSSYGARQGGISDSSSELYILEVESGSIQRLTQNEAYDLYPSWSPSGDSIIFSSDRDGNFNIYIMNANGSNQRPLTATEAAEYNPKWSPDGTTIIFSSNEQTTLDIYTMDENGDNRHQLLHMDGMNCGSADWSPDGELILFSCAYQNSTYSALYVMNADGSDIRQLTDGQTSDIAPVWSPDQTQLAFASSRNSLTYDVYTMDLEDLEIHRLTYDGGNHPTWWRQTQEDE